MSCASPVLLHSGSGIISFGAFGSSKMSLADEFEFCQGSPMKTGGSAALQQKMMRQRQLALERQRSLARNRIGVNVVAQTNPLAAPVKAEGWEFFGKDGPLSPTIGLTTLRSESTGGANEEPEASGHRLKATTVTSLTHSAPSPTPTPSIARGAPEVATLASVDELTDGLLVEVLADDVPQVEVRRLGPFHESPVKPSKSPSPTWRKEEKGSWAPSAQEDQAWSPGGRPGRASPEPPVRSAVYPGMVEDEDIQGIEQARPSNVPSDRINGRRRRRAQDDSDDDDEKQVPLERPSRVPAGRHHSALDEDMPPKKAPTSWNLNLEAPAPAPADRNQGQGRTWWKPWQNSGEKTTAEDKEVTSICAFSTD